MIVDSIVIPGGIKSTDGYLRAASNILEKQFCRFFSKPSIKGT